MRKLTLNVDALDVQSFETGDEPAESGTVHAQAAATPACGSYIDDCPSSLGCTSIQGCTGFCTDRNCKETQDIKLCFTDIDCL